MSIVGQNTLPYFIFLYGCLAMFSLRSRSNDKRRNRDSASNLGSVTSLVSAQHAPASIATSVNTLATAGRLEKPHDSIDGNPHAHVSRQQSFDLNDTAYMTSPAPAPGDENANQVKHTGEFVVVSCELVRNIKIKS